MKQMIMFIKACRICHEQQNLYTCRRCYSVNYCFDHADTVKRDGNFDCEKLKLCLEVDSKLQFGSTLLGHHFINPPVYFKPSVDMSSFLKLHNFKFLDSVTLYCYTDYISGPLTLYYGMKNVLLLNPQGEHFCYIVYIVAANIVDKAYVPSWGLFLHRLRWQTQLRIILIGLQLQDDRKNIETCIKCRPTQRKFNFECHRTSYCDYVNSDMYIKPKVIIEFQVDFNDWEPSSELILKLRDQNCPLLLTDKSKLKVEENINKLFEVLGSPLNIAYHEKNKFCSIRPCTDLENDGVSYRNHHLTVFKNLSVSSPSDTSSDTSSDMLSDISSEINNYD
ncbi:PREDICTED: uncharacterized protein LOC106740606 [Dinoponera quadriceps]|uniref:Uncharacterized protein LOC106740606 n=1 Tax=Dinoponera quadriceps TaxID=609295 RepID=A0A6P3WN92_DINQU|nr:PREDICTED: uncharacterized protein LOC106740606 [Dinoponera quadriceps]XP_014467295.1 PREDICTED: uncharacterized protein LOC106740606 [Dinoponera quadriceps]XP_014467296.1 PREDICTED: uncharacterized protein LOC106740606 [Dinoponera quadriceps]XP_014467297.1 PREDICTED: uncharacterized protein LOC106740606 [Dinoponera quadriceps]